MSSAKLQPKQTSDHSSKLSPLDLRRRYLELRDELNIDLRFQSGMHEQVYALQQSILLFEIDHEARFIHANMLFSQFSGFEVDELYDEHIRLVADPEEPFLPLSLIRCSLRGEPWQGQVRMRSKHGDIYWLNLTVTPFMSTKRQSEEAFNANGQAAEPLFPYKFVCVGFDISNQKRQKENLMKMIKQEKHYVRELEEAKVELEKKVDEKVNELRDSIRYSERIQQAMMPSEDDLKKSMPSGFDVALLFKPRDIVSGDHYWVGRFNKSTMLAAGDATGHGIPGAFMSMLGIGSVSRLVEERGITNPASLLTQVDEELRLNLKQEEGSDHNIQDSIEMAVVQLAENSPTVQYSAAMISSYLVGADGVKDIKGARKPLGGTLYDMDVEYETSEITFQPGETLYLLSDGFSTQLGDAQHNYKPMGKRRLRELLTDVQNIGDLDERLSSLDFFFRDWIGLMNQQTDDVMVIALRYNG